MTRPDPLRDELPDDVKAELAAVFKAMRHYYHPLDVEQQRFTNRVWHLREYRLP